MFWCTSTWKYTRCSVIIWWWIPDEEAPAACWKSAYLKCTCSNGQSSKFPYSWNPDRTSNKNLFRLSYSITMDTPFFCRRFWISIKIKFISIWMKEAQRGTVQNWIVISPQCCVNAQTWYISLKLSLVTVQAVEWTLKKVYSKSKLDK